MTVERGKKTPLETSNRTGLRVGARLPQGIGQRQTGDSCINWTGYYYYYHFCYYYNYYYYYAAFKDI